MNIIIVFVANAIDVALLFAGMWFIVRESLNYVTEFTLKE